MNRENSNDGMYIALIKTAIYVIFGLIIFFSLVFNPLRLQLKGTIAQGTVSRCFRSDLTAHRVNISQECEGSFTVQGKSYDLFPLRNKNLVAGSVVSIRYLPSNPNVWQVVSNEATIDLCLRIIGALLTTFLLGFFTGRFFFENPDMRNELQGPPSDSPNYDIQAPF